MMKLVTPFVAPAPAPLRIDLPWVLNGVIEAIELAKSHGDAETMITGYALMADILHNLAASEDESDKSPD
jgi:hypothetical protein